jgi:hypothetical protein
VDGPDPMEIARFLYSNGNIFSFELWFSEFIGTDAQLEAIFGWTGGKMASHYTKNPNRAKLARQGMATLEQNRNVLAAPFTRCGGGRKYPNEIKSRLTPWRPRQGSNLRPAA